MAVTSAPLNPEVERERQEETLTAVESAANGK